MNEEEAGMEAAALTIQLAWRRKKGQMVLHMKRRMKAEQEEMERAAIVIQNAWRRRDATKMVANMKKKMLEEEAEDMSGAVGMSDNDIAKDLTAPLVSAEPEIASMVSWT